MINHLQHLRNIGKFDSVSSAASIQLMPLSLIYAENAQGKTTLAAIFRSLASGDPLVVSERARLAGSGQPHIVIDCDGGASPAVFQNNAWSRTLPDLVVFDDAFVDENVCSGLDVGPGHRQNLHEWILGAQGVALNRALEAAAAQVDAHNRELKSKGDAIPAIARGPYNIDDFCALQQHADIDAAIRDAERALAAAQEQATIRTAQQFDVISLPEIDADSINAVLARDLPSLEAAAASQVQTHFGTIGEDGEAWVESGMRRIADGPQPRCPFCAQDLGSSPIIDHYRAYFSAGYATLKQDVEGVLSDFTETHGDSVPVTFERAIRVAVERRAFWSRFAEMPEIAVDTAALSTAWAKAKAGIVAALTAKKNTPLDPIALTPEVAAFATAYEDLRRVMVALNESLQRANVSIALVKERAAAGNVGALTADVARLRAIKARFAPEMIPLCDAYLAEKAAKMAAEAQRDTARTALDTYRQTAFPNFEAAINEYLLRFNASFRLSRVVSSNIRGGSSCTYNVVINNQAIAVAGATPQAGQPSFRNSLSAGDRNTLALAFFFASLDRDPQLANKVVVIDDPMTSLDEHRSLTTVQEMRRLAQRCRQMIVLSHEKPFLCNIWEGADQSNCVALEVVRDGTGSTIRPWDVTRDCITEHDRRHALLRDYTTAATTDSREVAQSLRPVLEAFCRVAYPEHCPPGRLLGRFHQTSAQRVGTSNEILAQADLTELHDLTEYANRFHHDTNPAWHTARINDTELLGFVTRVLAFAKRR